MARARCRCAASAVPPGSTKEVSGASVCVHGVDLALQPLDLRAGDPQAAFGLAAVFRRAEIGAQIEQVVLDARQHGIRDRLPHPAGRCRWRLVSSTAPMAVMRRACLGNPAAVAQPGFAGIARFCVDFVERDHAANLASCRSNLNDYDPAVPPKPSRRECPCPSKPPKSLKSIPPASPATAIGGALGHPRVYLEMGDENFRGMPLLRPPLCAESRRGHIIERPEKGRPSLSDRRLGLSVPRLSRPAAADPQVRRPARRRGVRLLQHAVEAAGGHEGRRSAHPSGGDLRRQREDLPQRDLQGIQGAPPAAAGRPDPAISPGARCHPRLRRLLRRDEGL